MSHQDGNENQPDGAAIPAPNPLAESVRASMVYFPLGSFLMTASYEGERSGIRVLSACQCSVEPILIAVSVQKGHSIEPLIRDSRHFALCVVDPDDRLLNQKFPPGREPVGGGDPFDSIPHEQLDSKSPIPTRSIAALDCEVVRHFDLEADHEIYIGQIQAIKVYRDLSSSPG